ncbi:lipoyl(octanoyl) transferase LipB [Amycolatopsis ultiminotia]|uniref:lipoyl(octanoyl) transferase LipB n=1 Tax=Amycolatopsis ultiminotia TaxID=543629 RepID=UPI0031F0BB87
MSSSRTSCRAAAEPVAVRELGTIEYTEAWDLQREVLTARADETGPDTMLLLEHPSVYTAGKRTEAADRPTDGTPVIDVDRGGKITWHGPGQLVGYPILKLADPIDVVHYVRRLEEALIAVCDRLGVRTGRVEGRSGVWIPADDRGIERKIAAIGIRVQRGVTMHGFELNCNADLGAFDAIVPCGIRDAGVTSLSYELQRDVPVAEVLPLARDLVLAALEGELPVSDDRWLPRPEAPQAAGVTFALQN